MKENMDLVEKLVTKTGISYTEAKTVLEAADWDILDAIIKLEAQGKYCGGKTAEYSTQAESGAKDQRTNNDTGNYSSQKKSSSGDDFKKTMSSFGNWVCKVVDKGNSNSIEFNKSGQRKFGLPVTVFALLFLFGFWFILPLMVVGLFFGFRYSFSGPDLGKDAVNNVMSKATDVADNIKKDFKNATASTHNENTTADTQDNTTGNQSGSYTSNQQ